MKYGKNDFILSWLEAKLKGHNPQIEAVEVDGEFAKYKVCVDGLILPNGDIYDKPSTFWAPVPNIAGDVSKPAGKPASKPAADPVPEPADKPKPESKPPVDPVPEPADKPEPDAEVKEEAEAEAEPKAKPAAKKTRAKK